MGPCGLTCREARPLGAATAWTALQSPPPPRWTLASMWMAPARAGACRWCMVVVRCGVCA